MFEKLFLFFLIFFLKSNESLKFHEFCSDLGWDIYEKPFYDMLKKHPIKKNVNCVIIPWNLEWKYNWSHELEKIKFNNAFTVCSLECNLENYIPLFKKMGIKVVFAQNATTKKYDNIEIVSIPYPAVNGIVPAETKDIFYSFIGFCKTHPVRNELFKINHPANCVMEERIDFHFRYSPDIQKKHQFQYQNVLARSRFSLCPRGNGVGSFRLWESLQAGAIPVLISDDYLLPKGVNWDDCIIKVSEKDVLEIPKILSSITLERELQMRENCLNTYKLFSGDNLIRVIKDYYEN